MKRKVHELVATVLIGALLIWGPRISQAATATLDVDEFNGSSGYVDMACLVNLGSGSSAWETVDFHVGLVGVWTKADTGIWVGQGGSGDHRYPADTTEWFRETWIPGAQSGTFDVWAVAHGYTSYPSYSHWDASTGDNYFVYP